MTHSTPIISTIVIGLVLALAFGASRNVGSITPFGNREFVGDLSLKQPPKNQ
jgi:predicted Kef-type K+ transport protein